MHDITEETPWGTKAEKYFRMSHVTRTNEE